MTKGTMRAMANLRWDIALDRYPEGPGRAWGYALLIVEFLSPSDGYAWGRDGKEKGPQDIQRLMDATFVVQDQDLEGLLAGTKHEARLRVRTR